MHHNLRNVVGAGVLVLLTGCQTGTYQGQVGSHPSSPSFSSSHMSLAQTVQDVLNHNEDPMLSRVHVETYQNTLVLSGYVKKIRQSDTAELIARKVSGGQNIQNNIIVRP
jgi:osmotically-inducible protein OsmY